MKIIEYELKTEDTAYTGEICFVCGVNADLLHWFTEGGGQRGRDIAEKALFSRGIKKEALYAALGLRNLKDRRAVSRQIVKKLWYSAPILGPFPLFDILDELESKGKFYDQYRDHSAHQLYVYLLGLFIYGTCDSLAQALRDEIKETLEDEDDRTTKKDKLEDEFLLRWLAASTIHDIGYVLENPNTDPDSKAPYNWSDLQEQFNHVLQFPICHVKNFSMEYPFQNSTANTFGKKWQTKLFHYSRIESMDELAGGTDKKFFAEFNNTAEKTCFGKSKADQDPVLYKYYNLTKRFNYPERTGYWDHGITSALILMHTWHSYNNYLQSITSDPAMLSSDEIENIKPDIEKWAPLVSRFEKGILAVSSAVAIHNIDLSQYKNDNFDESKDEPKTYNQAKQLELSNNGIDCGAYKIKLSGEKKTPFAFLLSFVDKLQNWDRPKFRHRRSNDHASEFIDTDYSLAFNSGCLELQIFKNKIARDHKDDLDSEFKSTLENDAVNDLISYSFPEEKLETQEGPPESNGGETAEDDPGDPMLNLARQPEVREKLLSLFKDGKRPDLSACKDKTIECDAKCMAVLNLAMFNRSCSNIRRTIEFVNLLKSLIKKVKELIDQVRDEREPEITLFLWEDINKQLLNLISMFEPPTEDICPGMKLGDEDFKIFVQLEKHYQYAKYPKEDLWPWDKRLKEFLKFKLKSVALNDDKIETLVESLKVMKFVSDQYLEYKKEDEIELGAGDDKFQLLFKKNKSQAEREKNKAYIPIWARLSKFIRVANLHLTSLKDNAELHLAETCLYLHKGIEQFEADQNLAQSLMDIKKSLPHNRKPAYRIWADKEVATNE